MNYEQRPSLSFAFSSTQNIPYPHINNPKVKNNHQDSKNRQTNIKWVGFQTKMIKIKLKKYGKMIKIKPFSSFS